ncbi:unnamed protein product [Prunus armeniaca]
MFGKCKHGKWLLDTSGGPIKVQGGEAAPPLVGKAIIGVAYCISAQPRRCTLGRKHGKWLPDTSGGPIKVQGGEAAPPLVGKAIIGVAYCISAQPRRCTLGVR